MNDTVRQVRDFVVSLKLTVVLLVFGLILVFAGTLAQVDLGIWAIQEKFFRSFIAIWHVGSLYIPLPGGYLVGGLLLINLTSAHIYRFKLTWRKAGIQLTHIGLILLLVGELLSGLWQEDYSMRLVQGETKNYSESYRDNELALVDTTDPKDDEVVVISEPLLRPEDTIQHPKLPFRLVTKIYYPNSSLSSRGPTDANHPAPAGASEPVSPATKGAGVRITAAPQPITYKQDERNIPTAFVELIGAEGTLGTWLVSTHPAMTPQAFEHAGRKWTIGMRSTRAYKPFALTLLKFSHDRYAGTEIPKNFSSRIRLNTPDGRDDREVLIYMNNPLRYAGLTFYQASFEPGNDKVTVLQVVQNPSWLIPYIACSLMTLGLILQFCIHLFAFVGKRRAAAKT
ncbi:MAG: ResB protein required for cytochrome C biosynthesis [Opitutus sp.]|nr:ResB protein required for cytochrome C biosynthesis [Opitutus sp.]